MSQASAGASGKARKGGKTPQRPYVRPLSPHMQVWRWHVTMLGSILHRFTGIGLYVGAAAVTAWLTALAAGPDAYTLFMTWAGHPLALVVWVGLTLCAFYHLAAGMRHLTWDLGAGLQPGTADLLANLSIWFAIIATIGFWAVLFWSGRISL